MCSQEAHPGRPEKQKPFGYVLDLRSNPGGLLEASIEIARQWINTGIIVSTKTKDGITDIIEVGPKKVLSKLIQKITSNIKIKSIDSLEDLINYGFKIIK